MTNFKVNKKSVKGQPYGSLSLTEAYELYQIFGDDIFFVFLYETFRPPTFKLCLKYLKDEYLAEDMTQNMFAALIERNHRREYQEVKNFKAWFTASTKYACFAYLKKLEQRTTKELYDLYADPAPSPDTGLDVEILRDLIDKALGNKQHYKDAIDPQYEGMKLQELAGKLGKTVHAVRCHKYQARRRITRLLKSLGIGSTYYD